MVLALASCSKEGEVREIYLPQQIGFVLSDAAGAVTEGMEMGVTATCRRNGGTVSLTEGRVAKYVAKVSADGVSLVPKSDADRICASYGDAGLHYTVFSPYSETGFEEIRVSQNQTYGQNPVRAVYGETFMEQVIETVMIPVSERPLCSILALEIPPRATTRKANSATLCRSPARSPTISASAKRSRRAAWTATTTLPACRSKAEWENNTIFAT